MATGTSFAATAWTPLVGTHAGAPSEYRNDPFGFTEPSMPEPRWLDQPLTLRVRSGDRIPIFAAAVRTLTTLSALPPNWDSYGAARIRPAAVQTALRLLASVAPSHVPAPSIVPTSAGGIQFEWHTSNADLELSINGEGNVDAFLDVHDGQTWEGPLAESVWGLARFLAYVSDQS